MFKIKCNKNNIPIVDGKIPINKNIRGQRYTINGYFYDDVISAFQKCIRKGLIKETLFWAKEIYDMKGPFRSNLINRLKIIASEDIGIANSSYIVLLKDELINYYKTSNENKKEKIIMGIIKAACISPKSRFCDSIIHAIMEPKVNTFPSDLKKYIFKKYEGKSLFLGQFGDTNKFVSYMNSFVFSLNQKDEKSMCYWAQKIFDLKKFNKNSRKTFKGKSKDPIYGIWEVLLNKVIGGLRDSHEIIKALLYFFDDRKNGSVERLFLVHALLYICYLPKSRETMWNMIDYEENLVIDNVLWNKIQKHDKIPMFDDAIDKHTKRGRKKNRNSNHLWNICVKLKNVPKQWKVDPFFDMARRLNAQREKEGINPRKRRRKEITKLNKKRTKQNNHFIRNKKKRKISIVKKVTN
jgi:hypothetical protein